MEQIFRDDLAQAVLASPHYPQGDKIESLRKVVQRKQAARIGGSFVDMQTANAILIVFDNLGDKNRERYVKMTVKEMALTAWEILGRAK